MSCSIQLSYEGEWHWSRKTKPLPNDFFLPTVKRTGARSTERQISPQEHPMQWKTLRPTNSLHQTAKNRAAIICIKASRNQLHGKGTKTDLNDPTAQRNGGNRESKRQKLKTYKSPVNKTSFCQAFSCSCGFVKTANYKRNKNLPIDHPPSINRDRSAPPPDIAPADGPCE